MTAEFPEGEFLRLADAVGPSFSNVDITEDPKALAKRLKGANKLIPPSIWRKLRMAFTVKGLPFFQLYIELYRVRLGGPVEGDLKAKYKRAAARLSSVRSPVDKQPLSPAAINHIALTKPVVFQVFNAIMQDRVTPILWGKLNATLVPLIVDIARDKEVFIKPTRQVGRERWATFRKMSPKQEKVERLRDDDPEAFDLMQQLGQSMEQIDAGITDKLLEGGLEIQESFIAGRPVKVGHDPATGERVIYDRDGTRFIGETPKQVGVRADGKPKYDWSGTAEESFRNHQSKKKERMAALSRVPTRTQVKPKELRRLDDETLEQLVGDTEMDAITDDKAKQGRLTRMFPTKRMRRFVNDPESGETRVEEFKVVTEGRYKGIFLDDLINSEGRLIEGTAYTYDIKKGKCSAVPLLSDPSEREPYITVADVVTRRQFQGKRIKVKTKKLYLKIDGTRQNKVLRNAIKALACNTGTKRGCIPSVTYEAVKGSQAAGFYFDPKDFGIVMASLKGMSLSSSALDEVKGYYKDLARAEAATKNLDAYEPDALASENEDGEKFQFIKGSHAPHTGEWVPFGLREKQKEAVAWMDANGNSGVCALETGVGKCVREDTLILTNKGLTPIRDINPGIEEPDTAAPVEGWSVLVGGKTLPIQSFYYGGPKPTIKVRTRRGFEVEGSLIHPLLVRSADGQETWVKTPDLLAGDYLCIERKEAEFPAEDPVLSVPVAEDFQNGTRNPHSTYTSPNVSIFDVPDRMTPEMGRLLGYIVAEGWANCRKSFHISQCPEKNPKVRADIEDLLQRLMGWTAKPEMDIRVQSVFLREYLLRMGVGYGIAKDKTVPEVILRSSKETVQQFIRGLVDAEGHVQGEGRNHIEFSTASEQLGRELQILLLRFGIMSSRRPKKVKGYDHTYWRLTFSGQDAIDYGSKIGFVSERKQAAVEGVGSTRNSNLDVVPHLAPAVGSLFAAMLEALDMNVSRFRRDVRGGSASFDGTVNHVRLGRRNPTYSFLREMLSLAADAGCQNHPSFKAIEGVVARRFFYDPIEVMDESDAVVMDITVDDDSHCFVGNGLMNHNTATSIAMMMKLVRDGLTDEDASYTKPDGTEVQTNGRFLFVCPKSLRGNIKKELKKVLSDPKVMTDRLDVLTFAQFSGGSRSGTVPKQLRGVPFWKGRIGQGGKRAKRGKAWDPALYVSIFFDEAQALKNPSALMSQAALKLYHPRKICLTASPMERNPMEAYVLAAITNNTPLFGRSIEAKNNRKEMRRFKERFCEVVGGRIVGVKQEALTQRDLHTWVKRNIFHADKTEVKEYELPTPEITVTPVHMPDAVEGMYRDVAKQFSTIMRGAAAKFRDKKKGDSYADRQAERLFSLALRPVMKLLNDMANRPAKALDDIAYAVEHGHLKDYKDKEGNPRPLPKPFLTALQRWQKQYTPEDLRGMAQDVGNPKIESAETYLVSKLARAEGSRSLLFADDKALCMEAGQHLARKMGGTHVVALSTSIHFFSGSKELEKISYPLDRALLENLVKDPDERKRIMAETGGITEHRLPFSKRSLRLHPALPAVRGKHDVYLADDWQQFVLKEIVSPDSSIATATLLGKSYMYGHNLQSFNTVIHLDRNNWNSESMKQRTARSWRAGQDEVVDEVTLDFTYAPDVEGVERDENDQTLDEIRASFQSMDAGIFDGIIKDAQGIELGEEWESIDKKDASLWNLDEKVIEMMASPFIGRANAPGSR